MGLNDRDHRNSVLNVDRAMAELRRGQIVTVQQDQKIQRVLAVETAAPETIQQLAALTEHPPQLTLTHRRAAMLGLTTGAKTAVTLSLPSAEDIAWIQRIAFSAFDTPAEAALLLADSEVREANGCLTMAIQLAKFARLLPAVLTVSGDAESPSAGVDLLANMASVSTADIGAYPTNLACSLRPVSQAKVPLPLIGETRFTLFRAADGTTEQLALMIGQPDMTRPVLVRVHSACLTGDIFGSLKCDCGEQLRNTAKSMAKSGGGVLLYLAQEGRGIGLANKLRAYALQSLGYDTLDADASLGFDYDERRFEMAAEMLRQLDIQRVRLMTNNPIKLKALEVNGIEVVARVPILGSVNPYNEYYLNTKAKRAGHLFESRLNSNAL